MINLDWQTLVPKLFLFLFEKRSAETSDSNPKEPSRGQGGGRGEVNQIGPPKSNKSEKEVHVRPQTEEAEPRPRRGEGGR